MKKLLLATTAVAMLSTMAFATGYNPLDYTFSDYTNAGADAEDAILGAISERAAALASTPLYVATGSEIILDGQWFISDDDNSKTLAGASDQQELRDDFFNITKRTYKKGADLVEDVYFDGDTTRSYITIELKTDRLLTDISNAPNFQIDQFVVKAKKDSVRFDPDSELPADEESYAYEKNDTYTYKSSGGFYVATLIKKHTDGSDDLTLQAVNIYDLDKGQVDVEASGSEIYMYAKAYNGDEIYLDIHNDYNKGVLTANPDAENILFYNIELDGATATWNVELYAYEELYLYECNESGRLSTSTLEWDESRYCYVGRIRDDVTYVTSDRALYSAAGSTPTVVPEEEVEEEEIVVPDYSSYNPSTGKTEVGSVVVGLVAVSVIAGAVVSMKK